MKLLPKTAALVLGCLALSCLTGCATNNNVPENQSLEKTFPKPQDGYGGLYVYRETDILGIGRAPALVIDNKNTVDIKGGSYYYTQLPAGIHTAFTVNYTTGVSEFLTSTLIGDDIKSSAVRFDIKSGKNYYIKIYYSDKYLDLVSEEEGQKGVLDCDRVSK